MGQAVTSEMAVETFPHGARVIPNDRPAFSVVDIDSKEIDGVPSMLGWAYPNKDFVFFLDDVTITNNGWIVKSEGQLYRIRPLTEQEGRDAANLLKEG